MRRLGIGLLALTALLVIPGCKDPPPLAQPAPASAQSALPPDTPPSVEPSAAPSIAPIAPASVAPSAPAPQDAGLPAPDMAALPPDDEPVASHQPADVPRPANPPPRRKRDDVSLLAAAVLKRSSVLPFDRVLTGRFAGADC